MEMGREIYSASSNTSQQTPNPEPAKEEEKKI